MIPLVKQRMEHSLLGPTSNGNKKNIKTTLKAIILAAVAASLITVVSAAPPGKGLKTFKKASTVEHVQKLKKGARYALVCKECDTVTIKEVANAEEVEALCHDGGRLHCDSCQKKVTIVNVDGKECMIIVP